MQILQWCKKGGVIRFVQKPTFNHNAMLSGDDLSIIALFELLLFECYSGVNYRKYCSVQHGYQTLITVLESTDELSQFYSSIKYVLILMTTTDLFERL